MTELAASAKTCFLLDIWMMRGTHIPHASGRIWPDILPKVLTSAGVPPMGSG